MPPDRVADTVRHGWAVTAHQAAGTCWLTAVVVLPGDVGGALTREWVYTAFGRGARHLSVVHGAGDALPHAVASGTAQDQVTRLRTLLTESAKAAAAAAASAVPVADTSAAGEGESEGKPKAWSERGGAGPRHPFEAGPGEGALTPSPSRVTAPARYSQVLSSHSPRRPEAAPRRQCVHDVAGQTGM